MTEHATLYQTRFSFEEVLAWTFSDGERLSAALMEMAYQQLLEKVPEIARKVACTWHGEVEVTPSGYLVLIQDERHRRDEGKTL